MTYDDLADFIDRRMRMSHIYQPVMLIEMLRAGGVLEGEEIASNPLSPPCIPPKFVLHGLSARSKFLAVSGF
jgi:hypothetical protein